MHVTSFSRLSNREPRTGNSFTLRRRFGAMSLVVRALGINAYNYARVMRPVSTQPGSRKSQDFATPAKATRWWGQGLLLLVRSKFLELGRCNQRNQRRGRILRTEYKPTPKSSSTSQPYEIWREDFHSLVLVVPRRPPICFLFHLSPFHIRFYSHEDGWFLAPRPKPGFQRQVRRYTRDG
jgi:hypothetical protein